MAVREGLAPLESDDVGLTESVPVLVVVRVGERVADAVRDGVAGMSCRMR